MIGVPPPNSSAFSRNAGQNAHLDEDSAQQSSSVRTPQQHARHRSRTISSGLFPTHFLLLSPLSLQSPPQTRNEEDPLISRPQSYGQTYSYTEGSSEEDAVSVKGSVYEYHGLPSFLVYSSAVSFLTFTIGLIIKATVANKETGSKKPLGIDDVLLFLGAAGIASSTVAVITILKERMHRLA